MGRLGSDIMLFRPSGDPSAEALAYIMAGETAGVDQAYKCRVRSPWWRVPDVRPADLHLTYMNSLTPQLSTNWAGVRHLNSVHGVYLKPELRRIGMDLLPLAALNSVTLLAAELVGRAYGGGMLKLEPREADRWPVPSTDLVHSLRTELTAVRPRVRRRLVAGDVLGASQVVDDVLLSGAGLSAGDLAGLRAARAALAERRTTRGRKAARA